MDVFKKGRSKQDLIQHKLKYIIGSFQERNLADTSGKDWIIISRKNYSDSFRKKEVICQKPPREGKKKFITMLKGFCVQNSQFISKSKSHRYLETPLLHTFIGNFFCKKTYMVEFLPERQTQVCTKLGPKTLRNLICNGT